MQLQRPDFAKGKGHIIYLPMADGDLTAWFNGVPAPVIRKNGQSLGPAYVIWPDETPENPTFLLRSENNRGSGGLLRPMWLLDQPPW